MKDQGGNGELPAATLREKVHSCRDSMTDFLRRTVEIETPSDDPASHEPLFRLLMDELRSMGFHVRRIRGRETGGHCLAYPEPRKRHQPRQLLIGHIDTVWPRGTLQNNPVEIDNGRMKGPGIFDMKAGVVEIVYALKALGNRLNALPVTPVVFLNSDEEIGSPESTRYLRCLAPLMNRAFVMEPASGPGGALKSARKGVGHFEIRIRGKASHAGLSPEKGANAIVELSKLIPRLHALNDPDRGITVNVGVIDGGLRANVVAPESRAEVDVRVPDHSRARTLEDAIRALEVSSEQFQLEVDGGFRRPPMELTPGNRALFDRARSLARSLDLDLESIRSGGASDGNITSQFTPTLDGLGAVGDGAHEEYEYIEIEPWLDRTALLALLVASEPLPDRVLDGYDSREAVSHAD